MARASFLHQLLAVTASRRRRRVCVLVLANRVRAYLRLPVHLCEWIEGGLMKPSGKWLEAATAATNLHDGHNFYPLSHKRRSFVLCVASTNDDESM